MNNAELFKKVFGIYAEEFWSYPEEEMLDWLVSDAPEDVPDRKVGKWIVVKRHEHYPSGKPHEQLQCPFCKRFDNNGDGSFCGYCGEDMRGEQN